MLFHDSEDKPSQPGLKTAVGRKYILVAQAGTLRVVSNEEVSKEQKVRSFL